MSEYSSALGDRIQQARVSAGLLQRELAHKLDCSRASVANYERGWQLPPCDVLAEISNVLGCNPGWLLTGRHRPLDVVPPELLEMRKTVLSVERRLTKMIGGFGDTRRDSG